MADQQDQVPTAEAPIAVRRVVGRQPIIGLDDHVIGFELIQAPTAGDADGSRLEDTTTVTDATGEMPLDIDLLFGDTLVYCRPGEGLLTGTDPVSPPSRRTVLEIPADACLDTAAVDRCRTLLANRQKDPVISNQ